MFIYSLCGIFTHHHLLTPHTYENKILLPKYGLSNSSAIKSASLPSSLHHFAHCTVIGVRQRLPCPTKSIAGYHCPTKSINRWLPLPYALRVVQSCPHRQICPYSPPQLPPTELRPQRPHHFQPPHVHRLRRELRSRTD